VKIGSYLLLGIALFFVSQLISFEAILPTVLCKNLLFVLLCGWRLYSSRCQREGLSGKHGASDERQRHARVVGLVDDTRNSAPSQMAGLS
ncbi:MAG: hypothetical protein ACPG5U_09115, partial [Planktomarina sp.]